MPKVEVGFATVVGHKDLTVFERVHRAGINVEIRIELLHRDAQATALQQTAQR